MVGNWDGLGGCCGASGLVVVWIVQVGVVHVVLVVVVVWCVVVVLFVRAVVVLCRTVRMCRCGCVLCRSGIAICWKLLVWTVRLVCRMRSIVGFALVSTLRIYMVVLHLADVVGFVCAG